MFMIQVKTGIRDGDFVWSSLWPAVSENRFHFNSKEDQSIFGTPYIDYGARQYDPAIARWNAVDPLAEKYYPVTPYAFCSGNPVNFVDADGKDWYIFSSLGQYYKKVEMDGVHRIAIHSIETLESGETYDNYRFVDFADPENDPKSIDNGEIDELVFVGEDDILSMMNEAGAFETGKINFIKDSRGGEPFDYSYKVLPKKYNVINDYATGLVRSNQLFLPEGDDTAHNLMNFGNYLWGATGYTVGLGRIVLQGGAHFNSVFGARFNGYEPQLDSKDDQLSIRLGARRAKSNNYKKYRR